MGFPTLRTGLALCLLLYSTSTVLLYSTVSLYPCLICQVAVDVYCTGAVEYVHVGCRLVGCVDTEHTGSIVIIGSKTFYCCFVWQWYQSWKWEKIKCQYETFSPFPFPSSHLHCVCLRNPARRSEEHCELNIMLATCDCRNLQRIRYTL